MSKHPLLERRDRALGAGAELFYDQPLEIVRGEGAWLYDAEGRRYVDMYNNVPCVGHGNPAVVEAMARQQATLNVHSRYLHRGVLEFAERLADLHHDGIDSVVFSCSGSEANEVALQMARAVTGQRGIVCSDAAYHGTSDLVGALTGIGTRTPARPDIRAFPHPDCYRPLRGGLAGRALTDACLDRAQRAIDELKRNGSGFAALLVCPIFANEGLPNVPADFMPGLAQLVRREGGLLIADEVQSGYGRSGRFWAYSKLGLHPDIVVSGKPMGNGLPLAATAAGRKLVDRFRASTGYFNTFASSPLQAAVGMAVLDEIERMDLISHAATLGNALTGALYDRRQAHPLIGEVRGCGLFAGVEMVFPGAQRTPHPEAARFLAEQLKDRGFLVANAGAHDNVLKIRPPLVFSAQDLEAFLPAYDASLNALPA